jgi:uncharacterized protein YceK
MRWWLGAAAAVATAVLLALSSGCSSVLRPRPPEKASCSARSAAFFTESSETSGAPRASSAACQRAQQMSHTHGMA